MSKINAHLLSLRALRDTLIAGCRTVALPDQDGNVSEMVYIPRFTVPAGTFEGGTFPSTDMHLGGILVDKYQCAHPDATDQSIGCQTNETVEEDGVAAVSVPMRVPWADISWASAKQACANRIVMGRPCHLVTPYDWATVAYLVALLGFAVHGNTLAGRDQRHTNVWSNRGPARSAYGTWATGSGPGMTSHLHAPFGIFDLVGNLWEWTDLTLVRGSYRYDRYATLVDLDGISNSDTEILIGSVQNPDLWPATDGLVRFPATELHTAETVRYANFVDNQDGTYSLTGCTRGVSGSPVAHSYNDVMFCYTAHHAIPGGYKISVTNSGLDNSSSPAQFNYGSYLAGPGGGAAPLAGDYIWIEDEIVLVTGVIGAQVTCSRAQLGTSAAAHVSGTSAIGLSRSANISRTVTAGPAIREEAWLGGMADSADCPWMQYGAFPGAYGAARHTDWLDTVIVEYSNTMAACRGGAYDDGSGRQARSPFALYLRDVGYAVNVGFRAAFWLERDDRHQWGPDTVVTLY